MDLGIGGLKVGCLGVWSAGLEYCLTISGLRV